MNKEKKHKILFTRVFINVLYMFFCITVMTLVFSFILVYYGPFEKIREYVVSTAMGTQSNHFIATFFLSQNEIDQILEKTKPVIQNAEEDVNNIVISSPPPQTNGSINIEIIDINESNFKGKLIVEKDPSKVSIGLATNFGQSGSTLSTIVKNNNAIAGINAGGFIDDGLMGTGSKPLGIVVKNGQVIYRQEGKNRFNVIGMNRKHVLVVSNSMTLDEINKADLDCAVSFGPVLIANGTPLVTKGGNVMQPRSAIAQRKDGAILLLAIDGRQLSTKGADFKDLEDVLLKYGAYNAANLDGGSSTTLIYQDKLINSPCDIIGERSVPSAFLLMP